jgi:hypothetical protein
MPTIRPVLFATLLLAAPLAPAAVTTQSLHRLGEADPGAFAGAPAGTTTQPSVGGVVLSRVGNPTWTGAVTPGIGSTLAMAFDGIDDRYGGALVGTATDNFGIEAWVRSNGRTTGNAAIAYNGNSGTSGYGLYRLGNSYGGLFGGVTFIGGGAPVANGSTHLALVRNAGVTTFYVNGVPAGTTTTAAPNPPTGSFGIGGNATIAIDEFFDGQIDEVRYFTFAPGQFSVGDLNLRRPEPVPAGTPLALAALGLLLGLAGWSRLRAR